MTGAIEGAIILIVLALLSIIFGARFGRRLTTPPGSAPRKVERRVWVLISAFSATGIVAAAWLWWAFHHHHAALGVLVVLGVYFASHFSLLALRFHNHRRGMSK